MTFRKVYYNGIPISFLEDNKYVHLEAEGVARALGYNSIGWALINMSKENIFEWRTLGKGTFDSNTKFLNEEGLAQLIFRYDDFYYFISKEVFQPIYQNVLNENIFLKEKVKHLKKQLYLNSVD